MKLLVFLRRFVEWGIDLLRVKHLHLWKDYVAFKLIAVNVLIMLIVIWLAGVSVKDFACVLVEKYQLVKEGKDFSFNQTMQFYLIRASLLAIIVAALIHFVFIKKILSPLKQLTHSTRQLMIGTYSEPIPISSQDEIGELTHYFNELNVTLKRTEENRKRMLSNISHDLRTPLSSLNGYLEALSNGVIVGERSLYQSLLEESQYLTRLVEQLHQLSIWEDRMEDRMRISQIQMDRFIASCTQLFHWELESKQITLQMKLEPASLEGDEDGIRQVLNNLLQNAISYNTGQYIWITGARGTEEYRITLSNYGEDLDNGLQELVFERFFQADSSRSRLGNTKGSGLGLAIVKEIVKKHGGSVGVSSENQKHSFWISLPLQHQERD